MIVSRTVVKNIEVKEEVDFCVCDKCGAEAEGLLSGLGRLKPYKISGHKLVVLMEDKPYKTHNGTLYSYNAGQYCGVIVTEKVMKKLVALQAKHSDAIKRLLSDEHARGGQVFSYDWTLFYPNGQQTPVHFIDDREDLVRKIDCAIRTDTPKKLPVVFVANSMDEAKRMAEAHFLERNPEAKIGKEQTPC